MLSVPFQHGQAAFDMGFAEFHNPYRGDSSLEWLSGWRKAAAMHLVTTPRRNLQKDRKRVRISKSQAVAKRIVPSRPWQGMA